LGLSRGPSRSELGTGEADSSFDAGDDGLGHGEDSYGAHGKKLVVAVSSRLKTNGPAGQF
jgi:hypothetical protein